MVGVRDPATQGLTLVRVRKNHCFQKKHSYAEMQCEDSMADC